MSGTYELWLTDDTGLRLANSDGNTLLDNIISLECSRVDGRIGWMALTVQRFFDPTLIRPDYMVQVWRQPQAAARSLWRVYFVRRWRYNTDDDGREIVELSGPDSNDLLRRRIVAHYAASAQASKTDLADDMMKEIVTQAIADGTNPAPSAGTRVWSDLSVAVDLGAGPTLTRAFAWEPLLTTAGGGVLPAIQQAAREAGTEVFFDVVPATVGGSSITFQFRTYTGQPGADRTVTGTVFDQARGNLKDPFLEYDYSEEINYVYAGGQGEEADRNIQQVSDAARYNASQWGRCEGFADARDQTADNGVREKGRALLEEGRPVRRFGGVPVDTEITRFGVDWDHGDRVTARYQNQEFVSLIRATTIGVDDGGEEAVRARLEYEAVV